MGVSMLPLVATTAFFLYFDSFKQLDFNFQTKLYVLPLASYDTMVRQATIP
jgi:hypothetical protein